MGVVTMLLAQTEFERLLQTQQQYQQSYTDHPKPLARRKLYRAEEKLVDYVKEEGYSLEIQLTSVHSLPIYQQSYPTSGTIIDTLTSQQVIKVFGKDKYNYYKIYANEKMGYVYKLDEYLTNFGNYPLALIHKYNQIDARVDALLSQPINNNQRNDSSVPCPVINHAGQRCGIVTRNSSGRCHLH
ncbi:MAG: hypothetical protein AB8E82_04605 [Aureispira sp.]